MCVIGIDLFASEPNSNSNLKYSFDNSLQDTTATALEKFKKCRFDPL